MAFAVGNPLPLFQPAEGCSPINLDSGQFGIDFVACELLIARHNTPDFMAASTKEAPQPFAEIPAGPSAFEAFLDKNQKLITLVGIALALGGGGYLVSRSIKSSQNEAAAVQLYSADSLNKLQDVISQNSSAPAAGSAEVLLADEQWKAGQQDAAVDTLRKFISSQPEHPAVPIARISLAIRLAQQGKNDEASQLFQQASTDENGKYLTAYALVSLGDLAKASGKPDEAEKFYKQAETSKLSPFAQLATQHLEMLKFKMPTEIEAPPAPAAPAPGNPASVTPDATLPADPNPLQNILNGPGSTPGN
jgi:predicted negative regulator of RcsB-dependent stress response